MASSEMHLHIVAFDVPYPPDYGGVIDVFYKIKALHAIGVKIHLHCFIYGRPKAQELEQYCVGVTYYKRANMWKGFLSDKPFIVQSRNAKQLEVVLMQDNYPILFEGLHCTYLLPYQFLTKRLSMLRMHNDEAKYYFDLAKREKGFFNKLYFYEEYRRLLRYEQVLKFAKIILCISQSETERYNKKFSTAKYLGPFHGNTEIKSLIGIGTYVLYHGNLEVSENEEAALYLLENVFSRLDVPFIIAGNKPTARLKYAANKIQTVTLIPDPDKNTIDNLVSEAHINILPTFQNTGIKLKLLNALYRGRFCLVNSVMVSNTGLEKYCVIAADAEQMRNEVLVLMQENFSQEMINARKNLLTEFSDNHEAEKIILLMQSHLPE